MSTECLTTNDNTEMICLISVWKLRAGVPDTLLAMLGELAEKVNASEKNTLMYRVNLKAPPPLNANNDPITPPPKPVPNNQQKHVIFIEHYANANAFHEHICGAVFKNFRKSTLKYFETDPDKPGWPLTETTFLTNQSGYTREPGISSS